MISAIIEEPSSGAWIADTVDTVAPTGSLTLNDGIPWTGTIVSTTKDGGRYNSRIIGGKGQLGKSLPDKWYNGSTIIDTVASDAISEAGEILGLSSLGVRVDAWQRKEGSLGSALNQLIAIAGGSWWVARDGFVDLGTRSGSVIDPASVSIISSDVDGSILLNVSAARIKPGDTWLGRTIAHVRHTLSPENIVSHIYFTDLPTLSLSVDYLRTYSARVNSQNSDGTLDLIVDGRFAVNPVPLLSGIPAKITILPGDQVTMGWLGGDPRAPYAMGTQQTGSAAAARVGDSCDCGTLIVPTTLVGVIGPVAFQIQYVPPGPTHDADVAIKLLAMAVFAPVAINLSGLITTGQNRVLL